MKKFLIFLLVSYLLIGTAMANPSLNLGTATGNPCEQVILPITLTNDPPLEVAGVSMDIGYDPGFFTPISAAIGPAGEAAGKSIASNIVSPGLFRVGFFSATDLSPIGDGIVANVTFEIDCFAPADSYVLTNTPSAATPKGLEVPTDGSDGTITVKALVTTTTTSVQPTTTVQPVTTTTAVQPTTTTTSVRPATTTTAVQPTTTTTSVRPTTSTTAVQPTTTIMPQTTTTTITPLGDSITICHIPPGINKSKGNGVRPHTIIIPIKALDAHLAHGDTIGSCEDS